MEVVIHGIASSSDAGRVNPSVEDANSSKYWERRVISRHGLQFIYYLLYL